MSSTGLLIEREKLSKDWTSRAGLYANLSRWPEEVEYYVKCPKCLQTHGSYKTMRDAHDQRLCDQCNIKAVDDIKKQVRQVIEEPWKKVRTLASIVRESDFDKLPPAEPEVPPVPKEPDDIFFGQDPMAEVNRMLFSIWTVVAVRDLAHHLNVDQDEITIVVRGHTGDYDEDDPNSTTFFTVEAEGEEWLIFKDVDVAIEYAEKRVRSDLETDPGIFSQSWLANFIDDEKLATAIGDPYADHGEEERNMDYESQLEKMVDEDVIEFDDPVFFKKNGEPRKPNKARIDQLDHLLEIWIEDTKPTFDPWEWLREIYGQEKATEEALKLVSIDVDKAAKDAVSTAGWTHFANSYDNESVDLDNGAVAMRLG